VSSRHYFNASAFFEYLQGREVLVVCLSHLWRSKFLMKCVYVLILMHPLREKWDSYSTWEEWRVI